MSVAIAGAHPPAGSGRSSGTIGGTSPAVRLPKVAPLQPAGPGNTLKIRPAAVVMGSTSIVAQGSAGTQITRSGNTYTITGGTPVNGGDLLHSFATFNLLNGDTAHFAAAENVKTIVARVTGGLATIDGNLSAPSATLILIDPAGVMFMGNAHLQLGGNFAVTTAGAVRLSDGLQINASASSPLSAATTGPAGFIFNADSAGALTFNSSISVDAGSMITVVGGPVSLQGGTLAAPGGRVNVIATASAGFVQLDPATLSSNVDVASFSTLAPISVSGGSLINTDGNAGGRICVRGATFNLADSSLSAQTTGSGNGLGVDLVFSGDVNSINSSIITSTLSTGDAGGITLTGAALTLSGLDSAGVGIQARSLSPGTGGGGGDVLINGSAITLSNGATVSTRTSSTGAGGSIMLNGTSLMISGGAAGLFANTIGSGSGGNIDVVLQGGLTVDGTGNPGHIGIQASTDSPATGAGNGGNITISAAAITLLEGATVGTDSFGTGNAGLTTVTGQSLSLATGAEIASTTNGTGAGGNLSVNISGAVNITGANANSFSGLVAGSTLTAAGGGTSGDINLTAGSLSIINAGQIDASTRGTGAGGNVTVNITGQVTLDGGPGTVSTGIGAQSTMITQGGGKAGDINLTVGTLSMLNNSEVDSSTFGTGNGGNVTITVQQQATLDAGASGIAATIGAESSLVMPGGGKGGNVVVNAGSLSLLNGAKIDASTLGTGDGGNVTIAVNGPVIFDAGTSVALAGAVAQTSYTGVGGGRGGDVTLTAVSLSVLNGADIAADTFGTGPGGNVLVNVAGPVVFNAEGTGSFDALSATSAMTAPGGGSGGNITLNAASLSVINGAQIESATSGSGTAGGISISLSGDLTLNDNNGAGMTGISSGSGSLGAPASGAAGTVTVLAGTLHILSGASLTSDAYGSGNAGDVMVDVSGPATLDAGVSTNFTGISADTGSTNPGGGKGGDVRLTAGSLQMRNGAEIDASTLGTGNGGNLTVNVTGAIMLGTGTDSIFTDLVAQSTMLTPGGGRGGNVVLTAGSLSVLSGSEVDASSFGSGDGGSVNVAVRRAIIVDGGVSQTFTGISAQNNGTGNAGDVMLRAGEIDIRRSATVSVAALDMNSTAGDVTLISGNNIRLSNQSVVSATAAGSGGNILLSAPNLIYVDASSITAQAAGAGGGIRIDPQLVVLTDTSVIDGLSGTHPKPVIIGADALLVSTDSQILTTEPRFTVDDTLASTIGRLPGAVSGPGVTLADQCGVLFATDNVSSFVVTGRGGSPVEPGGWLPDLNLANGVGDRPEKKR